MKTNRVWRKEEKKELTGKFDTYILILGNSEKEQVFSYYPW